ncbi:hypothetical protein LOTGIDRAFT_210506 [Lottia gigantea]|uniref:Chitobiosyldiphosphodolichol beta-mannosyltransferase n=1 Tax=Lottia gigantea TaxID=225164 RepID=V3ZWX9_LOTGI|nr:hypothetical protein LOTGIDRAFT_210506 [Lottia gigantea]ESO87135.1 hypothetical protein LOTGIDRAFT_210506 [Lottia gigantea]
MFTLYILWTAPIIFLFLYIFFNYYVKGEKSVCIVVLGDIGRSPRMQYHAVSFAEEDFNVDLVGFGGSKTIQQIRENDQINLHYLCEPPGFIKRLPRLLGYVAKVIYQSINLAWKLLLLPKAGFIFLQNPPSIPTLAVCWIVCLIRCSKLMVDWHNYGWTILGLNLGNGHLLVRFSKWFEKFFGKFAKINFCVTKAMKEDLKTNWNINAETLYDRPPPRFQKASLSARHDLFLKLSNEYSQFKPRERLVSKDEQTIFTIKLSTGILSYQDNRPALVISSTSWTEDEDFGILLTALQDYEKYFEAKDCTLPNVLCVITGKGPFKEFYKEKIEAIEWNHVSFCLPWLEPEDYPLLLGSADLGVCLHKSSSGLDLPMKVVDMFGCGLPVCAVDFQCLSELVQHNKNGLIFKDSQNLSSQLKELLNGFPADQSKLTAMRRNIKAFQSVRWNDQWKKIVLPLMIKDNTKPKTD